VTHSVTNHATAIYCLKLLNPLTLSLSKKITFWVFLAIGMTTICKYKNKHDVS